MGAAAILHRYLDVKERLGESGEGLLRQIIDVVREALWARTYGGSKKSAPSDDLLDLLTADMDPAHIENLSRLRVDRRLRDRVDLANSVNDPVMDVDFLVGRGCEPA